mmetsp:Transcript_15132/g.18705  ORF Transcript_15132/g.18705 Transcript_15132/m.18705 type:complete len:242 (+) Transcript_15132:330-1055(+)|eukprot:CAMPEP_0204830212 /NCGR_PEP_ID=MMETSP1346-20131115/8397_1 /ASSEMBLY_ACC=CAM_ASM_000771 /TAXON_ID=215587 /ORGANISM="Aplanochytrium stocchinoi, Strain GSBS06" /LENGTH=241 /DNA_ID=CAMNT_0051960367 /DNA_START=325 /DNA_END=1050 /DNA_ORIENTATION=-
MSQAAATATTLTAGGLTAISVAYQVGSLTTVLLGKAVEGMTQTAVTTAFVGRDHGDKILETIRRHSVQYMLMELDVEAKVSCARSLVNNIRTVREDGSYSSDYVEVCLKNVSQICDELIKVLHRIYNELDAHRLRWFSSWRSPDVDEDLVLIRTMCKVFDSRLDTLVKCLGVDSAVLANGESSESGNNRKLGVSKQLSQLGFFKGPPKDMHKYERENTSTTTEAASTETTFIFSDSDAVLL